MGSHQGLGDPRVGFGGPLDVGWGSPGRGVGFYHSWGSPGWGLGVPMTWDGVSWMWDGVLPRLGDPRVGFGGPQDLGWGPTMTGRP